MDGRELAEDFGFEFGFEFESRQLRCRFLPQLRPDHIHQLVGDGGGMY